MGPIYLVVEAREPGRQGTLLPIPDGYGSFAARAFRLQSRLGPHSDLGELVGAIDILHAPHHRVRGRIAVADSVGAHESRPTLARLVLN